MTEETMKANHEAKNIGIGMGDQIECSCGWKSKPYWDGYEWAMQEWEQHITSLSPSTDARGPTFQQDPRIHALDGECVCGAKSCPQCTPSTVTDEGLVERRAIELYVQAMIDMGCCTEDIAAFHQSPHDGDDGIALQAIEHALREASGHTALLRALEAIHEARLRDDGSDEGYGWNVTKLNRAMDAALPLLGKPVPPKPDIDVEALRAAISKPFGGGSDNHGS